MILTNKYNLPEVIVKAVSESRRPNPDYFHVTEFISPPLIRHLKMLHWDELEEDVSERLWSLLGLSVHAVLDNVDLPDALHEEHLAGIFNLWDGRAVKIVGRPDLWKENEITDWKVTSVYSFLIGDKPEWERQLNLYRWLYKNYGFETKSLKVHAILRDWMTSKAGIGDYPPIPFQTINVRIWDDKEMNDYMLCQNYRHEIPMLDDTAICTPEERWRRPTTYAVMKAGRKRAIRVFGNPDDAAAYQDQYESACHVEIRQGADIRCERYCPVRMFCPVKVATKKKESDEQGEGG